METCSIILLWCIHSTFAWHHLFFIFQRNEIWNFSFDFLPLFEVTGLKVDTDHSVSVCVCPV